MVRKFKSENKQVSSIGLLLVNDSNENVLKDYIDKNKLDFTVKSLKEVDNYLEKIRKRRKDLTEEEVKKIILRSGAYLGEVIRQLEPKRFVWISYDSAINIDAQSLPLEKDITTCFILYDSINRRFWFPLAKPYKSIQSGRGDNLWSFAVVCLNFKEASLNRRKVT